MAAIRSSGTRPEVLLRRALSIGFPRRRIMPAPHLVGKPDYCVPALRLAVFADGCFWHGCSEHGRKPDDNAAYWSGKIARNRRRDRAVTKELRALGYSVVRIWEHELEAQSPKLVSRLRRAGAIGAKRRRGRPGSSAATRVGGPGSPASSRCTAPAVSGITLS